MRAAFRTRRLVGLLAVTTVGFSTTVLGAGLAQATPSGLSFSSVTGEVTTVTVPAGTCAIDWIVSGGRGGAGSDGSSGGAPAGLQIRTLVAAGDQFVLAPGSAGADAGSAPDGGTNPRGEAAWNGAAGTSTGGGGGAASVVLEDGAVYLAGSGRDGAGVDGGAGGSVPDGWAAQRIEDPSANPTFTLPEGQFDGRISGTGVTCGTEATQAPRAPTITQAVPGPGQLSVWFQPASAGGPEVAPSSGWEYSIDGGVWTRVENPGDFGGFSPQFYLQGLVNGQTYQVRVRATSFLGAGAVSQPALVTPFALPGAPTSAAAEFTSDGLVVSWAPPTVNGTYPVNGYRVTAVTAEATEEDPGDEWACTTDATARRCVMEDVPADGDYVLYVSAVDSHGHVGDYDVVSVEGRGGGGPSTPVTTDPEGTGTGGPRVVTPPAAPAVPAVPPAGSGAVTGAGGASLSTITPGETITLTGDGYAPRTRVDLYVYSTPQFLGTVVTDDAGAFAVTVTLPRDLEAGQHHLVASGLDPAGNPRYLSTEVTLAAAAAASAQLAWTGVDVLPVAGAGLLTLLLGAGLVVLARRRAA
ncbi:fibronectin type III domain-containing protein [Modestobacter sp. VKM Ac-2977]|uniref:fibronectin type III domain-containing protein n=1 Tax=Modestobacter sp. VKM Ac-2977 TaxID=3004131 RepID=UPI0022AA82C2|nr:fibronectin type III domain-containing protein [Modestobacter sp. VKM Ac-2977]MCZ2822677.1 fibronectin type III domain-containing protein [Modestobacter sp. VKM Ac-2977]